MNAALLLGLNIVVWLSLFFYFNRKLEKALETGQLLDKVRREVGGILTQLNRTTERNIGLLEERISALKELLDNADKRILMIRRETEKHEVGTQVYNQILQKRSGTREDPAQDSGKKALSVDEIMDLHKKGISSGIIAAKIGTTVGEVELVISLHDRRERE